MSWSNAQFNQFYQNTIQRAFQVRTQASQEYSAEDNSFENFETVALLAAMRPNLRDITPEDVAWVFRLKHIIAELKDVSIREDMIGRTIDDINYGLLIAGMRTQKLIEEKASKPTPIREGIEPVPSDPY